MTYEVEQKFYASDIPTAVSALRLLGAELGPVITQIDTYFSHPARDFAGTDEALRLRQEGDRNYLAYKGPRIDSTTKTRLELELSLPDGEDFVARLRELFELLGFSVVVHVEKRRQKTSFIWQGSALEVVLDDVMQLGKFMEIEGAAEAGEVAAVRAAVASLADKLALGQSERLSYCELLLRRQAELA